MRSDSIRSYKNKKRLRVLNLKSMGSVMCFWIVGGFLLTACSILDTKTVEKKFVLEREWAHNTLQSEYLGARINNTMAPVVSGNLIIAGNEIDGITAYQLKTGSKVWQRKISGGVTSSAKVDGGLVYFGAGDGFVYALVAETGQTKWAFPLRAEGIGTPIITDKEVYFVAGNNSAYALNKSTGEQIWYYSRLDNANISVRGASEPSIYGPNVLMGFSDGYLVAIDRQNGQMKWERQLGLNPRFRDVDSKPVVDGDRIFVSSYDGQLYCLKATDGQVIWSIDEGGFTPATVVGDSLYFSSSTRKVMAVEKSSGKVRWSINLKNQVASQPILVRGLVLFGEWNGRIRAVDSRNGQDITNFSTGRGATSRLTLAAGEDTNIQRIFVMTKDANIFSLKLRLKSREEVWPWEIESY